MNHEEENNLTSGRLDVWTSRLDHRSPEFVTYFFIRPSPEVF